MVRLTRWLIGLTIATAAAAIGATVFSGLQWREARQERRIAQDQLKLAQMPNVDVALSPKIYSEGGFQAEGKIVNRGNYTIKQMKIYGAANVVSLGRIQDVWSNLTQFDQEDVVPNIDYTERLSLPALADKDWKQLIQGNLAIVFILQARFNDASGTPHTVSRCLLYSGPERKPQGLDCRSTEPHKN